MNKVLILGALAIGIVIWLKTRQAPIQQVTTRPGTVAEGGKPSWEETAIAAGFGIAAQQLGNIFGAGSSGPSPAGNDIDINAD